MVIFQFSFLSSVINQFNLKMKVFNKNTAATVASRQITEDNNTEENPNITLNPSMTYSNIKTCTYDINDFLPEPIESTKFHIINMSSSFVKNTHQQENHIQSKSRNTVNYEISGAKIPFQGGDIEQSFSLNIKLKEQKLHYEAQLQQSEKQKNHLSEIIEQLKQKLGKSEKESQENQQKMKQISVKLGQIEQKYESLKKIMIEKDKQKNQYENQRKKIRNRVNFFSQKYQVNIQPKIKHSYTVQVQTDKYPQQKSSNIQDFLQYNPLSANKNYIENEQYKGQHNEQQKKYYSNRKISCHSKPQFYELYQRQKHRQQFFQSPIPQHRDNENVNIMNNREFDLNNHPTSRSQVVSTGLKPKKPALLLENNVSAVTNNSKLNNMKKINERLGLGKKNITQPMKKGSKLLQLEIGSVNQQDIDTIVDSILNF